ncbi:hypothetical protein PspLS_01576 [Pyricularia sp. CBS 133598]|nr:hypothetical protein PspLS_01576 [Pyricularia sp. CBS 133598]
MASASTPGDITSVVVSPGAHQAPAPTRPELSKGTWSKRYGRYDFERFDHVNHKDALVGGASIGNVQVDCNLLFAESQWGVLEEADAGIVYIDFHIQQPTNYRLDWAKIEITLQDLGDAADGLPAQITPYYGPRRVVGPESTKTKLERVNVEPKLEIMGAGGGLGGKEFETMFEVPCRWEFTGNRVCRDGKGKKVFTGLHRTLEWTLKENELDPGQQNLVKTAFAFARQGEAFLMKIKVRGGLKGTMNRIKAKFSHKRGSKDGISTTRIGPHLGPKTSLDSVANDLDKVMEMKNQQLTALELPRPQPATFWQVSDPQATATSQSSNDDAQTAAQTLASLPSASRPQAILPSVPASVQIEAPPPITASTTLQDRTQPTLENLSAMAELFMRPSLETIRQEISLSTPTNNAPTVATLPSEVSSTAGETSRVTVAAAPETEMISTPTQETTAVETTAPGLVVADQGTVASVNDEVAMLQEALTKRMKKLRGALLWMIFQPPKIPLLVLQRLYQLIKWPRLIFRLMLRVFFGV